MVNALDWVVSVVPAVAPGVEAVTLTGVLTVPELTVVTTSPLASEIAVVGGGGCQRNSAHRGAQPERDGLSAERVSAGVQYLETHL